MRQLHPVLLIPLLVLSFSASKAEAQQRGGFACGNGKCEPPLEDCAYCPQDCGVCSRCGDGKCSGNETCLRCPKDCGECQVTEENQCGNLLCDAGEDCASCSEDCGKCLADDNGILQRWMALLRNGGDRARQVLRQIRQTLGRQYARLEQDAEDRNRAARQLLAYLDDSPDLASYFSGVDRRLLERVGGSNRPTPLNIVPTLRVTYELRRAVRREAREIETATRLMLQYPSVRESLKTLPGFAELETAIKEGDIGTVALLIPQAKRSLTELTDELNTLKQAFEGEDRLMAPITMQILEQAYAQDQGEATGSRQAFSDAIQLLQKMRESAADPDAALPSLEERLTFLQTRRNALAGVLNLPEDDVRSSLGNVQKEADSTSPKTLINLLGMLRFIRSSPNFQSLEESAKQASDRMYSSVESVLSVVTQEAHGERAEEILKEEWEEKDLERIISDDIDVQKEALRTFLQKEDSELQQTLSRLPEEQRHEFLKTIEEWEREFFGPASTPTELRKAVLMRSLLVQNLRKEFLKERNPFLRFVYSLQSFFGLRS